MADEKSTLPQATEDCQTEVMDTRPDTSPYDYTRVIQFRNGEPLRVPEAFLQKYPKLFSRVGRRGDYDIARHSRYTVIMGDISYESGHTLVHYLYTGTYQSLKPKGSSPNEKRAAEFETCVRVYALAREYEMHTLEELTREEIKRLGRDLPVAQLLNLAMAELYTADDTWFRDYVKSLIELLMENPSASPMDDLPEHSRQKVSLPSFLLAAMVDLWHEKKDALRPVAIQGQESTAVLPSETQPAGNPKPEVEDFMESTKVRKGKKKKEKNMKKKGKTSVFDWGAGFEGSNEARMPVASEPASGPVREELRSPEQKGEQSGKTSDDVSASAPPSADSWSFWGQAKQGQQPPFNSSFSFGNDSSAPSFSQSSFDTPSSSST